MANTTEPGRLISDEVTDIIVLMNFVVLCGVISVVGMVTNVVNIIVFIRMGFRETVNITFLALAVADLCGMTLLAWISVAYNPLLAEQDINFIPPEVEYLTGGWPRIWFTRVTSWITAFATFERCLCILFPFRVREMITPKRVVCVLVLIYVFMAVSVFPTFYSSSLGWKVDAATNKTVLGLIFRPDHYNIDAISFKVGFIVTAGSFVCVIVSSVVLFISLKRQNVSRRALISGSLPAVLSTETTNKDKNAGKMVLIISIIFIICYTPANMVQVAMSEVEGLTKGSEYNNMNLVAWSISYTMDATNSAVNIFIYMKMSSKFRATFKEVFFIHSKADST